MKSLSLLTSILLVGSIGCSSNGKVLTAKSDLLDKDGKKIGEATLTQQGEGVRIKVKLSKLTPGKHAFHIHRVGQCHKPTFKSAGGHFNPFAKEHGLENPKGPHAGDLPNFEVKEDGTAEFEVTAKLVTLKEGEKNSLFQTGGTCLMVHQGPDDMKTDPTGAAGPRAACGIIKK